MPRIIYLESVALVSVIRVLLYLSSARAVDIGCGHPSRVINSAICLANFPLRLRGGSVSSEVPTLLRSPLAGDAVVQRQILDTVSNTWKPAAPETWEFASGALVVPSVPDAVEQVLDGACDRVFVGAGRHEWKGSRLIVGDWRADEKLPAEGSPTANSTEQIRALEVTGEEHARLWGMWFLEPGSHGRMDGLTVAFQTQMGLVSTLDVWGGPWALGAMEVRSLGGTALKAAKEAVVACDACGLGGLEGGDKDEYGRWCGTPEYVTGHPGRAHFGVHLYDVSPSRPLHSTPPGSSPPRLNRTRTPLRLYLATPPLLLASEGGGPPARPSGPRRDSERKRGSRKREREREREIGPCKETGRSEV